MYSKSTTYIGVMFLGIVYSQNTLGATVSGIAKASAPDAFPPFPPFIFIFARHIKWNAHKFNVCKLQAYCIKYRNMKELQVSYWRALFKHTVKIAGLCSHKDLNVKTSQLKD